jgi:hypothetical protein
VTGRSTERTDSMVQNCRNFLFISKIFQSWQKFARPGVPVLRIQKILDARRAVAAGTDQVCAAGLGLFEREAVVLLLLLLVVIAVGLLDGRLLAGRLLAGGRPPMVLKGGGRNELDLKTEYDFTDAGTSEHRNSSM